MNGDESEVTLGAMFQFVSLYLPAGWELTLRMGKGDADLSLFDPDGDTVEVCFDNLNTGGAIAACVDRARLDEGLSAVHVPERW